MAELLGLERWLTAKPRHLSGGMQQRVALGRAIARNASLYLMDEPLSNLDALLRVKTRTEVIKLARSLQTTVIYVTHDQIEAMTMAHRIAIMKMEYCNRWERHSTSTGLHTIALSPASLACPR